VGASSKNNEATTGGVEWRADTPTILFFFMWSRYVLASLSTRLYARSKNSTWTNWCGDWKNAERQIKRKWKM